MKPPTRIAGLQLRLGSSSLPTQRNPFSLRPLQTAIVPASACGCPPGRSIHSTSRTSANALTLGFGPAPPPPPPTAVDQVRERLEKKKRHGEMLKHAREMEGPDMRKKRLWKDVYVREVEGHLQVFLDERPLLHPTTKQVVRIPLWKPHLAAALALEWDMLTSVKDAKKQHMIPLTSLVCRALDIAADDAVAGSNLRSHIAGMVLNYLDTDTLLCWAPRPADDDMTAVRNSQGESLHDVQKKAAAEVVGFLTKWVWPGVALQPALQNETIMPARQSEEVRAVVGGWVWALDAWDLAGLERAVLAGKGTLVAARLLVQWGDGFARLRERIRTAEWGEENIFGIEEAAKAASIEVDWQTGRWGEVEDTHDVNKEDMKRQFGSVVLIVSGM